MLAPTIDSIDDRSTAPATDTIDDTTGDTTLVATAGWEAGALCRTVDASNVALFFSEDLHDIAAAKRICAACPALAPCLQGAIEREEPVGVWGGQLFLNGRVLAVKRRRGRPPKVPRPEEQLPEVPVPEHLVGLLRTA